MKALEAPTNKDSLVFLAAVISGVLLMTLLKLSAVPQLLTTLGMAFIIVVYSFIVFRFGRLRVRLDQAGDNAYYLGLIFTLFSMAWALWQIGNVVRTTEGDAIPIAEIVIGDFGVALGTTLVGIICRIVLHQMRTDPADVETASRIELAQAASGMVVEIKSLTNTFGQFVVQLQQKHEDQLIELTKSNREIVQEMVSYVRASATESAELLASTTREISQAISTLETASKDATATINSAVLDIKGVEPPPVKLSRSYSNLAGKVDGVSSALANTARDLEESSEVLQRMVGSVQVLLLDIEKVPIGIAQKLERNDEEVANSVNSAREQIDRTLSRVNESSSLVEEGVQRALGMLREVEGLATSFVQKATASVRPSGNTPVGDEDVKK